jgi:hypothetical protein
MPDTAALIKYLDHTKRYNSVITVPFKEIEEIINEPLPFAARTDARWWTNDISKAHDCAQAWLEAGWRVDNVNFRNEFVTFETSEE